MKKTILIFTVILFILSGCSKNTPLDDVQQQSGKAAGTKIMGMNAAENRAIPGQYIVQLDEKFLNGVEHSNGYKAQYENMKKAVAALLKGNNIEGPEILSVYFNSFTGFAVKMDEQQLEKLKRIPFVKTVGMDMEGQFFQSGNGNGKGNGGGNNGGGDTDPVVNTQVTSWGTTRVGGAGDGAATGKTAWILDSGVQEDHPDLNVDLTRRWTKDGFWVQDSPSKKKGLVWREDHIDYCGHGTSVAGIVGAIDNHYGVAGIASGVKIVPLKLSLYQETNMHCSFSWANAVEAVDYIAAHATPGDVVTMSFGGGFDENVLVLQLFEAAVLNLASKGVLIAPAAGNSAVDANSITPARLGGVHANIYTVSAMDSLDNFTSWSCWGNPPVAYSMPGLGIYTTSIFSSYRYFAGTSASAPHMAGVLIMSNGNPIINGYVNNDPDGNPDPIAKW